MYEIRRDYVKFKENTRHEEGKMWDELYNNHRELRKSFVSKYSKTEILHNKQLFCLPRIPAYSSELLPRHPPTGTPFAERYKQFVTFKAETMRRMHLRQSERRPNYFDLYAKQFDKTHKNQDNYQKVLLKFENKRKEGHGPLNILKEGVNTTGVSSPESGGTKKQDGFSSRESGSRLSVEDRPQRKRKLAVANQNTADFQRFHTVGDFDFEREYQKSQPPQLEKLPTVAFSPKKI